jgi:hypothetical protein
MSGPYFVADEYEWQDADSLNDAVVLALDCQKRQEEPVDVYEKIDWRRCLLPEEAS